MLWSLAVILVILWLIGAFVVHAGGIVHVLLVAAIVVVVFRLLTTGSPER